MGRKAACWLTHLTLMSLLLSRGFSQDSFLRNSLANSMNALGGLGMRSFRDSDPPEPPGGAAGGAERAEGAGAATSSRLAAGPGDAPRAVALKCPQQPSVPITTPRVPSK